jgi:predicted RNA-binding Zn-ribbon protein involved in translation (DUF1610 family)
MSGNALKDDLRAQARGENPEDAWSVCRDALAAIERLETKLRAECPSCGLGHPYACVECGHRLEP